MNQEKLDEIKLKQINEEIELIDLRLFELSHMETYQLTIILALIAGILIATMTLTTISITINLTEIEPNNLIIATMLVLMGFIIGLAWFANTHSKKLRTATKDLQEHIQKKEDKIKEKYKYM